MNRYSTYSNMKALGHHNESAPGFFMRNVAPRSYMPVPRLKMAGAMVKIAGATGEMPEPR